MTVLTVRAQDTATAMEEIAEKLGKDSFIIGTKKIGNEMLVKATNNPKTTKNPIKKRTEKFNQIISKEINRDISDPKIEEKSISKYAKVKEDLIYPKQNDNLIKELNNEFQNLKNQLNSMIITDMAGLSPNLSNTIKVKLKNMGFSDYTLIKFKNKLENYDTKVGIQSFIEELADTLTFDDAFNNLLNSQYVFIVGASGSGKTSFSAKIAAMIAQEVKNKFVALAKLGKQDDALNDDLKTYSRLINIPNINILPENAYKQIETIEKKLIIDVSEKVEITLNTINKLKERVGSSKVLTIVVIPSGSNKYSIKKLMDIYGSVNPMVAFTKLDENNISAEELSVIAENKCSIGYLTEKKSILKSINFTDKEFLAQYLKDNFNKFV